MRKARYERAHTNVNNMQKKVMELNKTLRGNVKMDFQAGDVVKVYLKIREGGKERVQMFEGLIIAINGGQSSSPTITVRKVSHGVGVEMIVPLLSKNVDKIELVKRAKVRRAKLYYVRDLTAKQSRMKYKDIKEYIKEETSDVSSDSEKLAEEVKEEKLTEVAEKKK